MMREWLTIREQLIIDRITKTGKILNVGCAFNPTLHKALRKKTFTIGIDIDAVGLAKLPGPTYQIDAQVMSCYSEIFSRRFMYIVAGEVIEHLECAASFLHSCRDVIESNGRLIITVPNTACPFLYARVILQGKHQNHEHVAHYDLMTMSTLLERCGFRVLLHAYPRGTVKFNRKHNTSLAYFLVTVFAWIGWHFVSNRLFSPTLYVEAVPAAIDTEANAEEQEREVPE